jgi:hypothetical protein
VAQQQRRRSSTLAAPATTIPSSRLAAGERRTGGASANRAPALAAAAASAARGPRRRRGRRPIRKIRCRLTHRSSMELQRPTLSSHANDVAHSCRQAPCDVPPCLRHYLASTGEQRANGQVRSGGHTHGQAKVQSDQPPVIHEAYERDRQHRIEIERSRSESRGHEQTRLQPEVLDMMPLVHAAFAPYHKHCVTHIFVAALSVRRRGVDA